MNVWQALLTDGAGTRLVDQICTARAVAYAVLDRFLAARHGEEYVLAGTDLPRAEDRVNGWCGEDDAAETAIVLELEVTDSATVGAGPPQLESKS
jgi:hypothetical protein